MTRAVALLGLLVLVGCGGRTVVIKEQEKRPANVRYGGGTGDTYEDAVVIKGAENQKQGVEAEYAFISEKHGKRGNDWEVVAQSLMKENGKAYDMIEIELRPQGGKRYYYFDLTECSWVK